MKNISAVCFDVFGTLISYRAPRTNPYRWLVQEARSGRRQRLPFLTRNVTMAAFAQELGLSHRLPIMQKELDQEIAGLRLFPEVAQVLHELRMVDKKIAVCSNLAQAYGPAVRRLLPDLDACLLSYEIGAVKPDSVIYHAVCEALGCSPHNILFVGDSRRCDYHGPQAFGMRAWWLDRSGRSTLIDAVRETLGGLA